MRIVRRYEDPPMSEEDQESYVRGYEAALRGEEPSPVAGEAWRRGHTDAKRIENGPSQQAHGPLKFHESQEEAIAAAWALKLSRRHEQREVDSLTAERIASALERIAAALEGRS